MANTILVCPSSALPPDQTSVSISAANSECRLQTARNNLKKKSLPSSLFSFSSDVQDFPEPRDVCLNTQDLPGGDIVVLAGNRLVSLFDRPKNMINTSSFP